MVRLGDVGSFQQARVGISRPPALETPLPNGLPTMKAIAPANPLLPTFGGDFLSKRPADTPVSPLETIAASKTDPVQLPALDAIYPVPNPKASGPNILLPDGIPVFFLHGTYSTTASLRPIIDFISNIQTRHPTYMSFIPEVRDSVGIEKVDDVAENTPSSLLALRDMGDFQFQVVHQNLQRLQRILNSPAETVDEGLASFFSLHPSEKDRLLPVIREHLTDNIFEIPEKLVVSESLASTVKQGVGRIRREFDKLSLNVNQLPMMDTYLLYNRAFAEGKTINLNMFRMVHDPDVVNLRPLNLRDVTFLNAYLMFVEKELTERVAKAYQNDPSLEGIPEERRQKRASAIARKLTEAIAPRGMTFGHSQGGTVLMSALLSYLNVPPKTVSEAFDLSSADADKMGGRFIGMGSFFSAPLNGIPPEPKWAKPIADLVREWEEKIRGPVDEDKSWFKPIVQRWVWWLFERQGYAVSEMRQNSDLMKHFQEDLLKLRQHEVTIISAHDTQDSFVEPSATILTAKNGDKLDNVFNVPLQMPNVEVPYDGPQDVMESEVIRSRLGLHPDAMLTKILRSFSRERYEAIAERLKKTFAGLFQHRALLHFPEQVHRQLGQKLIKDPERQLRLMNPSNFEPFRYQSLVARRKIAQKEIFGKPTPEALQMLERFGQEYPQFLVLLLKNAREGLPLTNAASYEANRLLDEVMDLMEKGVKDKTLRQLHRDSLQKNLKLIASAAVIAESPHQPSASQRAEQLLKKLG